MRWIQDIIRSAREEKRLSQKELAALARCSPSSVSQVECGNYSWEMVEQIADALEIDIGKEVAALRALGDRFRREREAAHLSRHELAILIQPALAGRYAAMRNARPHFIASAERGHFSREHAEQFAAVLGISIP